MYTYMVRNDIFGAQPPRVSPDYPRNDIFGVQPPA